MLRIPCSAQAKFYLLKTCKDAACDLETAVFRKTEHCYNDESRMHTFSNSRPDVSQLIPSLPPPPSTYQQ